MTEQRQTDLLADETFEHMKRLAASYLQLESPTVRLSPTVLVHEAYLKLSKQASDKYQSRGHFQAIAATMMRRILVDHARARHRIKLVGGTGTDGVRWGYIDRAIAGQRRFGLSGCSKNFSNLIRSRPRL